MNNLQRKWFLAWLLTLWLAPGLAAGQNCEAHFPFDGSLVDVRGSHDGQMIAMEGGGGMPEFVEGRSGQALALSGASAMRAFLDLNPDVCRQITLSAWLRVDPSLKPTRMVISTGNPGSPGMRIGGGGLTLNGPGNGLLFTHSGIK